MGVLFDLDGTLIDTAPDMAAALNALLVESGQTAMPVADIRPYVSTGAPGVIRQGFGDDLPDVEFEALRQRFLDIYTGINGREARVFEGYTEVLDRLETAGWPWGIVTNKPGWLSEALLDTLGLAERVACLVCGDTLPNRKPHPEPLQHAARELGLDVTQCVYVGDDERDMLAAQAAGMPGIVANYGYIPSTARPADWPAAAQIDTPGDLPALLGLN